MRAVGRTSWNEEDANIAAAEFNHLWPLCQHGADRECCYLCDSASEPGDLMEAKDRKGTTSVVP